MPEYDCPKCGRRHYGPSDTYFCYCNGKVSSSLYHKKGGTRMEKLYMR